MIRTLDRNLERAISGPANLWSWYELAKRGYSLEELEEIAIEHGFDLEPVRAGYREL